MNIATISMLIIIALAAAAAVLQLLRRKKRGCSCGCEGCAYKDNCGK